MTRRRILCRTLILMLIAATVCVIGAGVGAAEDVNVELEGIYAGGAPDVAVAGSYAYVANGWGGLVIVDISNPAAPILTGSYDTAGYAEGVAISDSYAYVAEGNKGLEIIDISNPAAPTLAGSYNTAVNMLGVAVAGSYAYVADFGNGLVIVDISNPAAPTLAGSYDTTGSASGVAVAGSYAYVADGSNGLVVIDVSNPAAPALAGSYAVAGRAADGVAVAGNYAYVAAYSKVVIVDISNPAAPVLAGSYDGAGRANNVALSGSYVYVADISKGLIILHTDAPAIDTIQPTLITTTSSNSPTITFSGSASDDTVITSATVNSISAAGTIGLSIDTIVSEFKMPNEDVTEKQNVVYDGNVYVITQVGSTYIVVEEAKGVIPGQDIGGKLIKAYQYSEDIQLALKSTTFNLTNYFCP